VIGKVKRGNGMRGLLKYLSSNPEGSLLSTNLLGDTPRRFSQQFGDVRELYPRANPPKDPVVHLILRPAPGEDLSREQWEQAAELFLARLGYADSPYVAYLHNHGDGHHLHIATYRINFFGKVVSDSNDRFKAVTLAAEVAKNYGLTIAPAPAAKRQRITRPQLERLLRDSNREGLEDTLRQVLDEAAASSTTIRGFLTELDRRGIKARLKVATRTGQIQGFSLTLPDGTALKGSDLGRRYSLANLASRHDLREDLRPPGPYLEIKDLTSKEVAALERDGLNPDSQRRVGNRFNLLWTLPPGNEQEFTDHLAARLPHRFLSFPQGPAPEASATRERDQILSLRDELLDNPHLVNALPREILTDREYTPPAVALPVPPHASRLVKNAGQLQLLSLALTSSADLPRDEVAPLRARYRATQIDTLAELGLPIPVLFERPYVTIATATARPPGHIENLPLEENLQRLRNHVDDAFLRGNPVSLSLAARDYFYTARDNGISLTDAESLGAFRFKLKFAAEATNPADALRWILDDTQKRLESVTLGSPEYLSSLEHFIEAQDRARNAGVPIIPRYNTKAESTAGFARHLRDSLFWQARSFSAPAFLEHARDVLDFHRRTHGQIEEEIRDPDLAYPPDDHQLYHLVEWQLETSQTLVPSLEDSRARVSAALDRRDATELWQGLQCLITADLAHPRLDFTEELPENADPLLAAIANAKRALEAEPPITRRFREAQVLLPHLEAQALTRSKPQDRTEAAETPANANDVRLESLSPSPDLEKLASARLEALRSLPPEPAAPPQAVIAAGQVVRFTTPQIREFAAARGAQVAATTPEEVEAANLRLTSLETAALSAELPPHQRADLIDAEITRYWLDAGRRANVPEADWLDPDANSDTYDAKAALTVPLLPPADLTDTDLARSARAAQSQLRQGPPQIELEDLYIALREEILRREGGPPEAPNRLTYLAYQLGLSATLPPPEESTDREGLAKALELAIDFQGGRLLTARDLLLAEPTPENERREVRARATLEALVNQQEVSHLSSEPLFQLRETLSNYLASPTPSNRDLWLAAHDHYQSLPDRLTPETGTLLVRVLEQRLREDRQVLKQHKEAFYLDPESATAQASWTRSYESLATTETALSAAKDNRLLLAKNEVTYHGHALMASESAFFASLSPDAAKTWTRAERDLYRATLAYDDYRAEKESTLTQTSKADRPAARVSDHAPIAARLAVRALEKHLVVSPPRATTIARRINKKLLANTPAGQRVLAALSPVRFALRHLPGGGVAIAALDVAQVSSRAIRSSYAIYLEARAAQDRFNGPATQGLSAGNFSSLSLAKAVTRSQTPIPAIQTENLKHAIATARSAEAHLLVTYRGYRRHTSSAQDLSSAAARALAARGTVSDQVLESAGLAPLRRFTAALGSKDGRAVAAWIHSLTQAGLSPRAISLALIEAAPAIGLNFALTLGTFVARRAVTAIWSFARTNVLDVLREQNEGRR
jgi:hypothetical protein